MERRRMQQWDLFAVPNAYEDSFSLLHVVSTEVRQPFTQMVAVVELDWRSTTVPNVDEIRRKRPRPLNPGERVATWIDELQPRHWVHVGTRARRYQLPKGVANGYGGAEWYGRVPAEQLRRTRAKAALAKKNGSTQSVFLFRRSVQQPGGDWAWATVVGPDVAIDWSEALRVPGARIKMRGPDPHLHRMLEGNREVGGLYWVEHGRDVLDLSSTDLYEAEVSFGSGLQRLVLPDELRKLTLVRDGDGPPPTVAHPHDGRGVEVSLVGHDAFVPIRGLERVRSMTIETNRTDLDLTATELFPDVETVRITLDGGGCRNLDRLATWSRLRVLTVADMYDFDPEQLPAVDVWEQLDTVAFHGLPRSAAAVLRRRLKGAYRFEVSGARGDKWLAENAQNPFRHWVDINERAGKKATKAYVRARIAAGEGSIERAIRSLVADLNKIAEDLPIETVERDEAWVAVEALGFEFGATPSQSAAWFDADRDF